MKIYNNLLLMHVYNRILVKDEILFLEKVEIWCFLQGCLHFIECNVSQQNAVYLLEGKWKKLIKF